MLLGQLHLAASDLFALETPSKDWGALRNTRLELQLLHALLAAKLFPVPRPLSIRQG